MNFLKNLLFISLPTNFPYSSCKTCYYVMPDVILNIRKFYVKPELLHLIYVASWNIILYGEN